MRIFFLYMYKYSHMKTYIKLLATRNLSIFIAQSYLGPGISLLGSNVIDGIMNSLRKNKHICYKITTEKGNTDSKIKYLDAIGIASKARGFL